MLEFWSMTNRHSELFANDDHVNIRLQYCLRTTRNITASTIHYLQFKLMELPENQRAWHTYQPHTTQFVSGEELKRWSLVLSLGHFEHVH